MDSSTDSGVLPARSAGGTSDGLKTSYALMGLAASVGVTGFRQKQCRMNDEQQQFLRLVGQAPARLTAEQVAWVLGCQPHDVPILVAARLLRPLGNPTPSCVKYFSRLEVLDLAQDRNWLVRATNAVNQHWQRKNAHKKGHSVNGSQNGPSSLLDTPAVAAVG